MNYTKDSKLIKQWLDAPRKEIPVGVRSCSKRVMEYLISFREMDVAFGRMQAILYFFMKEYDRFNYLHSMFVSLGKQRKFIKAIVLTLRTTEKIPNDLSEELKYCHTQLQKRLEHLNTIFQDVVRETPDYLFYQQMDEDSILYYIDNFEEFKKFESEKNAFNLEHQQEIAEHMSSIQEELEVRRIRIEQIKADKKAEKEKARNKIKQEKAEQKEIEANIRKERAHDRHCGIAGNAHHYRKPKKRAVV